MLPPHHALVVYYLHSHLTILLGLLLESVSESHSIITNGRHCIPFAGVSFIFDLVVACLTLSTILTTDALDVQCCGEEVFDETRHLTVFKGYKYRYPMALSDIYCFD
jgi:hypothetical protein